MIHLIKLAVGVRDVAHLEAIQASRAAVAPPLRHATRNAPRRADEVTAGGSIYWVIGGAVLVRQRVTGILSESVAEGGKGCSLVLDPTLVRVAARPLKAFQGWRYLAPEDAPPDLVPGAQNTQMPEEMRRNLAALGLL
ncbi:MAG: hypothetical protein B7X08_05880 [Acidocella sp. 20-63-7]|nr:MAG: hypothetical protein B7X08_05880 [Acidocella sp. 20-63-7]HQT47025.1 DUF1489 domain-containing protein [Acidocella sp.]